MRTIITFFLPLILVIMPSIVSAHIYLKPDGNVIPRNTNGVTCDVPGTYHAIFESNSTVDILYSVGIQHDPFEMYLIDNTDENIIYTLVENIPDIKGLNTQSITFPDIECASCTLKLSQNASYSSCADITLTRRENILPTNSVSHIISTQTDQSVFLEWDNPDNINQVMILQSDFYIESTPDSTKQYQNGDEIDGATVIFLEINDTYNVNGLIPQTDYYFQFFTRNMAGNYSKVNPYKATTAEVINNQPMISLEDIRLQSDGVCEQAINIVATVTDVDAGDMHQIQWVTNPVLENQSTDPLEFYNSSSINDGTEKQFEITAVVTDNGAPIKTHSQVYNFSCAADPNLIEDEPIAEANHAPKVVLIAGIQSIYGCEDIVEVFAAIEDEDENDTFTVKWSVEPELENQSLDPLVFMNSTDTSGLQSKHYKFTVNVTDSGVPAQISTKEFDYVCEPHPDQGLVIVDNELSLGGLSHIYLWILAIFAMVMRLKRKV
ncbi:hypothetical protein [Marinicellulosiphila megalodicopiae]|uniref:hypothetical protein n=1 Tax=Marinicellulosiphila megalodicopiae TaxID=2724896 RepID=UPI003BB051B5